MKICNNQQKDFSTINHYKLKKNLQYDEDYVIVNKEIWEYIAKNFGGSKKIKKLNYKGIRINF